ncbi:hypothetical protein CJF31_00012165 [Rutstroemia sp. NJR-2017a BVV2]|nr:hypothetical protein CJF31_00012165 [Rutstroemia sp. NJR-2017a BVV2]
MDYNTVCAKLGLDTAPIVEISVRKLRWGSQNFDYTIGYLLEVYTGEDHELENGRTHSAFPSRKRKAGAEFESTFSTPYQIKKLSNIVFLSAFNHRYKKTPISNPKDHQFPQDVVLSLPGPQLPIPRREPTIDTIPTTPHNNSISIDTLLNAADYIAGSPQSQQLSTTRNSSIQIASGAALSGYEQDSTVDEQAEIGSSNTNGLEAQAKAYSPPSIRRRLGSFSESDLSLPQQSSGITWDGEIATGSTILGNTNISIVSQAEDARQIGVTQTVEGDTLDSSIGAPWSTDQQRDLEIEFVYSNPQKENLERYLEEPFRTPLIARFQSGLENHQQGIEQDVTFSITIDRKAGFEMIRAFDLQCRPQVQSDQGQVQQYSDMPMEKLPLLGDSFYQATTRTTKYRSALGPRCTCVSAFISGGRDTDSIVFSIMVDDISGFKLRDMFGLRKVEVGL